MWRCIWVSRWKLLSWGSFSARVWKRWIASPYIWNSYLHFDKSVHDTTLKNWLYNYGSKHMWYQHRSPFVCDVERYVLNIYRYQRNIDVELFRMVPVFRKFDKHLTPRFWCVGLFCIFYLFMNTSKRVYRVRVLLKSLSLFHIWNWDSLSLMELWREVREPHHDPPTPTQGADASGREAVQPS